VPNDALGVDRLVGQRLHRWCRQLWTWWEHQPSRAAKCRTSASALIHGGLLAALASYHLIGSGMPAPAAENPTSYWPQPFLELVALHTHPIDLGQHSFQQGFGRGRGNACPLKLADFAALSVDLGAHPLDFGSEMVKLHGILVQPRPFRSGAAKPSSGGLPFPEAAGGSTA
jgi:hypothetical protein